MVLNVPADVVPVCSRCGTTLERQPLVRPLPLLVFLAVGTALLSLAIPGLIPPAPRQLPAEPALPSTRA